MNWVIVTAADAKTGARVNGTVTIATYSELGTTYTDSAGHPHRVRQVRPGGKGATGPTGKKLSYKCGQGDCILTVTAHGYTDAEVTLASGPGGTP
jgi:hypothetical protein